uniref:Reverse transcriptase domain-containing protein n=1 Tax=Tanacetum cinerariifolium TaxID=118510 RepID=A0A6L2JLM2_TANCI|nr:reverse transcriptase domain-containing protein [Tanacetum cinerariifolium]
MDGEGNGDLPIPDLRTMEELCQPSLNGRGSPIAPIAIQATNFGLKNDMIQQVQNSCQFHGGTFMKRRLEECYDLIENMTAYHNDWDTSAQRSESSSSITSSFDTKIAVLKAKMAKINKNLMRVLQVNQKVKVVTPSCETCGGPHSFNDCPATVGNTKNVYAIGAYQETLPGNIITNSKEDLKGITTRSGTEYQGPTIPTTSSSPVAKHETEATKDTMHPTNNGSTKDVQPLVGQTESPILNSEPVTSIIIEPVASLVSINLMPLSVWNKLSLPDLSPTCMTLELDDRSISRPVGVAEDVFVKVGTFYFPTDFVVVDFVADRRVPLILKRSFLKTGRALIDVFEGKLTLHDGKEAITFNLDQTSRYSANYNDMMAKRIDVIDMACEEYSQEVLSFSDVIASGNPTPYYDPIVSTTSLTLTPFGNSDFLLEEVDAFLALEDDPTSPEVDQSYLDTEGDILLLETFLETICLNVEEKTALITILKSHKKAIAWKLSNIKVFGNSFQACLSHLEKMLKRCEGSNLCLNWEKSHFMVKEGIVLGHKVFKEGIEVDKAKVDVIAKLPHPTTVKAPILIAPDWDMPFELMCDASDFVIGAVLGQRQEKHFRPIHYASKTMIEAESSYTTTEKEMLAVVYALKKF